MAREYDQKRVDRIKLIGVDRAYDYKMQDALVLKQKINLIRTLCIPGKKIGKYKVITPYKNQCRFLFPDGSTHCLTYIYLAQHLVPLAEKTQPIMKDKLKI